MEASVIDKAVAWFRSRNCLNQLCRAIKKGERYSGFADALSRCEGHMICDSFTWSETPEGHSYWSDLDDEFYCWWLG